MNSMNWRPHFDAGSIRSRFFIIFCVAAFGTAICLPSPCAAEDSPPACVANNPISDLGPAPGSYRILSDDSVISFPFELYRGDIKFAGEINGHPVRMLIDNGVMGWDQILFFGSPLDDSLNLNFDGTVDVGGSGEGSQVSSRTATGITISFPGVEFTDQTAVVMPYTPGAPDLWEAEGQVCGTFFKHFVVEFDFDKMMMTLTPPDKFEYKGKGHETSIVHLGQGLWGIPAIMELADGRSVSLDLSMDLGYGDMFEINTTGEHKITPPPDALPGSLGFGIQGETLGHFGRVKSVQIGGYKIVNVVAGFIDPEYSGAIYGEITIGLGLFSRFNFIYDYPHQRMFLEPNHTYDEPFEYDMSGLWVGRRDGDALSIRQVHPKSPAAEAGVTTSDRIIRINGRPAVEYSDPWKLQPLMQREGETVTLVLLRDQNEVEVSIVLRRLI
jgi:hypothetical protein